MARVSNYFPMKLSSRSALVVATLLLSACAGMPEAPVAEQAATVAAGYGRAFGRVSYVEDGKEKDWSASLTSTDLIRLFVRSNRTGQIHYLLIEGNGGFFWPLQAGDYVMVGYQSVHHRMLNTQSRTGRLWAAFSIPKPGQAVYLGDLRIEVDKTGNRVDFADRYADALARDDSRLKQAKLEAVKGLMRPEGKVGNYTRVTTICGQEWGVKCDMNNQGVEPLRPEGTARGFPLAESLTPLLEWKPAGRPEITYDVAVFESIAFALIGTPGVSQRISGAAVAYAEGLRQPRFMPATALQPGKEYEWTVRFRDGDTVSSWSGAGSFAFLVVVTSAGTGQNFGFSTPSK